MNGKDRLKRETARKKRIVAVAAGREPADLVLKNARYVNVFTGELLQGDIAIAEGIIAGIGAYAGRKETDLTGLILLPGLMDAHIHLESSLVSPAEFARAVLPHGTTAVFADPHEIANVMGADGIRYMLQATEGLPVEVRFQLPSCVPATPFDESCGDLFHEDLAEFYGHPRVSGLAEVMNFVGVAAGDVSLLEKIAGAQIAGGQVDGHAPDLAGKALAAYAAAGVRSDHECHQLADAEEKIRQGMQIMIREGTAARNLAALVPLLKGETARWCMFCTDDKHPNDLLEKGHMDHILKNAVALGADPICAVQAATLNPARFFGLSDRGAIAPGYQADLVAVEDLTEFSVRQVYRKGVLAAQDGAALPFAGATVEPVLEQKAHDTFCTAPFSAADFKNHGALPLLGMVPGEITTLDLGRAERIDPQADVLKIAVIERHHKTGHIGVGFIKGYGLTSGAVATSIAHDSHNIIVVGTSEEEMAAAAGQIEAQKGGIVVVSEGKTAASLPLAIGGIMSDERLETVNEKLEQAKEVAHRLGVGRDIDPFMTLSFMALPVIPTLRITTRGVFDAVKFQYVT